MKQLKHLLSAVALFLTLFLCLGFHPVKADTVNITLDGGTYCYTYAQEILTKVNEERAAAGVSALTMDTSLLSSAMTRAAENALYYSHTRPNGTKFSTVNSKAYGENIAWGYGSSTAVMSGWMNSSGHKANILDSAYKSMGVGCFVHNGTYYWVQLFSKSSASSKSTKTGFVSANPTITAITDNLAFSRSSYSTSNPRIITYNKNKGSSRYALVAPSTFKWTSSNTSVATVDSTGLITIKNTGTTVITRTFASNTNIYLQFTLEPYLDLADAVIEAIPNQLYTGSAIYPQPKVTYQGKTLNLGTDYTLSYVNNIYASDNAQLTINGMGAYSGKQTVYFTIYKASFQNVTPSSYDVTYTGQTDNLVKFTVTNTLGEVLTEGVHYTVEYKIYERQKTIVATVLGIYPYNCSETVYLNLKMLSIADAEVTVPSKVVLTGICVQPTPTVTYNGKVLTKGTD